LNIFIL